MILEGIDLAATGDNKPVKIAANPTTHALVTEAAASSAIIGQVSIDQTTPGTTDRVTANIDKIAGSAIATGAGNVGASVQRVTLSSDGAGVTQLINLLATQTLTEAQTPFGVAIAASSGASAQTAAVGATTTRVIITSTVDCWIAIGSNPTATATPTGSYFLLAGVRDVIRTVTPSVTKIAVLSNDASTGQLSVQGFL